MEFRKEREIIDAICVLKNVIGREMCKEKGQVFPFFADLKAAFDEVKRREIWRMINRIGVDKKLREGIRRIY